MTSSPHPIKETFQARGEQVVDRIKDLVHEGNVRRVVLKHDDKIIAEFPVTAAVIGAVLAPMLAAVAAIAALVTDCTIEVERTDDHDGAR